MKLARLRLHVLLVGAVLGALIAIDRESTRRSWATDYDTIARFYKIQEDYWEDTLQMELKFLADWKQRKEEVPAALIPQVDSYIGQTKARVEKARLGLERYRALRIQYEQAASDPLAHGAPPQSPEAAMLGVIQDPLSRLD